MAGGSPAATATSPRGQGLGWHQTLTTCPRFHGWPALGWRHTPRSARLTAPASLLLPAGLPCGSSECSRRAYETGRASVSGRPTCARSAHAFQKSTCVGGSKSECEGRGRGYAPAANRHRRRATSRLRHAPRGFKLLVENPSGPLRGTHPVLVTPGTAQRDFSQRARSVRTLLFLLPLYGAPVGLSAPFFRAWTALQEFTCEGVECRACRRVTVAVRRRERRCGAREPKMGVSATGLGSPLASWPHQPRISPLRIFFNRHAFSVGVFPP